MSESRELNRRAVGEWIKVRRKSRNMTQIELGEAWHVSQAMICQVESGKYEVSMSRFLELCEIFEIDSVLATDQIEALAAGRKPVARASAKAPPRKRTKKATAKPAKPAAKRSRR